MWCENSYANSRRTWSLPPRWMGTTVRSCWMPTDSGPSAGRCCTLSPSSLRSVWLHIKFRHHAGEKLPVISFGFVAGGKNCGIQNILCPCGESKRRSYTLQYNHCTDQATPNAVALLYRLLTSDSMSSQPTAGPSSAQSQCQSLKAEILNLQYGGQFSTEAGEMSE